MAVCGGVNGVYTPENLLYSSIIGAQSPEGRSRSFSIDANGYAKGKVEPFLFSEVLLNCLFQAKASDFFC
jgi:hypothetical protein